MACIPFTVTIAVLAGDNKRQFSFFIGQDCVDDKPVLVLIFIFRDRKEITDEFQDRVKLEATVRATDSDKAQRLIDKGMNNAQIAYMKGPLTDVAKDLADGKITQDKADAAAAVMVNSKPVRPA